MPTDRETPRAARVTLLLLALAGTATAQQPSSRPQDPESDDLHILDPATPRNRRFFDGVIAMVGDRAILHSTVRAEAGAKVAGERGANKTVNRSQVVEFAKEYLRILLRREVGAQSARLTDPLTPTELKELLNAETQRYLNEKVADFGSYNSYLSELEKLNTSWDEVSQQYTDLVLQHRAEAQLYANVMSRAGNRANLWVTPREMRRFYDQNPDRWHQDHRAEIEPVLFQDQGRATAAAADWRSHPELEAEEIATRHDGRARRPWIVEGRKTGDYQTFILAFAKEGAPMQVSDPVGSNGQYWVMRLRRVQQAGDKAFSDPEVQKQIVRELVEAESKRMQNRAFELNSTSLFWFVQPHLWQF